MFAFTLLWGLNNGYHISLSVLHLPVPLLFVCLSLWHWWMCMCETVCVLNQCCENPLTLMRSQPLLSLWLPNYPSFSFFSSFSLHKCSGKQESLTLPWQLLGFGLNKCFCTKHLISISTSICMNDHTGLKKCTVGSETIMKKILFDFFF